MIEGVRVELFLRIEDIHDAVIVTSRVVAEEFARLVFGRVFRDSKGNEGLYFLRIKALVLDLEHLLAGLHAFDDSDGQGGSCQSRTLGAHANGIGHRWVGIEFVLLYQLRGNDATFANLFNLLRGSLEREQFSGFFARDGSATYKG